MTGKASPAPDSIAAEMGASPAPELDGGEAWLNTDRPLRLREDLRGHVVLLDFWTYCCINCMHALPELKAVEHMFKDAPFQVIGVHSGKFDAEKDAARINDAIARYGIEHPVVVDSDYELWKRYGVKAWPTFALIDAEGNLIIQRSGEPTREALAKAIRALLEDAQTRGVAAAGPLKLNRHARVDARPLSFPGKVAPLEGDRIAVADSGHHRIVVARNDGTLLHVVGSGEEGFMDGPLDTASFRRPQGIAGKGDVLYVADTENHAIRKVDLKQGQVTTVGGTGIKGETSALSTTQTDPLQQHLRSPWDLVLLGSKLYIAMAGSHQLWALDLERNRFEIAAGSGREGIVDGPSQQAALAQPSGLTTDGTRLYFADSEASAVRSLHLGNRRVETLVGKGLMAFGDADGPRAVARMQHPLGVTLLGDFVYVVDTYNNKVKRVSLRSQLLESVTHDAKALYEPGGITTIGQRLLVADTNHHRLVWVDPATGAVSELKLQGLSAPGADALRSVEVGSP